MITAALNGDLNDVDYVKHDVFGLHMPTSCKDVPSELLNPKNTWENKDEYDIKANELAIAFNTNFKKFIEFANDEILDGAPRIKIEK
jgi:phosphoenolpyruvate carboxykinase (ATP)